MLQPLSFKGTLLLVVLIIVGFIWILVDQYFLPEISQRMVALSFLLLLLLLFEFLYVKPQIPFRLANTIAVIVVPVFIVTSLVLHLVINHNFTVLSIFLWVLAAIMPYITGLLYALIKKQNFF